MHLTFSNDKEPIKSLKSSNNFKVIVTCGAVRINAYLCDKETYPDNAFRVISYWSAGELHDEDIDLIECLDDLKAEDPKIIYLKKGTYTTSPVGFKKLK